MSFIAGLSSFSALSDSHLTQCSPFGTVLLILLCDSANSWEANIDLNISAEVQASKSLASIGLHGGAGAPAANLRRGCIRGEGLRSPSHWVFENHASSYNLLCFNRPLLTPPLCYWMCSISSIPCTALAATP